MKQATWEASSTGWIRPEHLVSVSIVFVSGLVAVMAASTWQFEIRDGVWMDMEE